MTTTTLPHKISVGGVCPVLSVGAHVDVEGDFSPGKNSEGGVGFILSVSREKGNETATVKAYFDHHQSCILILVAYP